VIDRRDDHAQILAAAIAEERLRILAGLIRTTGDWELAEDCLQDAVERALVRWPADGIPDNPAAWLSTTAYRRALDVLRRRRVEAIKLQEVAAMADLERSAGSGTNTDPYAGVYRDDQLRLLFTCCHPALPIEGRVALTLKTVAGLSTRQIAAAFLVSEATMGQRLLRTRNKIAHAGIQLRVPEPHRLAERIAGVLAVIYLVYNAGYGATAGESDHDLAHEGVRLAELAARLLPDDGEVQGLRALLLLQHARRAARADLVGDLVPMEEQDRGRWDHATIATGLSVLAAAGATDHPPGPYRLQAEIAAMHATAPTAAATDWARIVAAYDALLRIQPSPVVALNRVVALGFRDGPEAGLGALASIDSDPQLAFYYLLPAVRADFLRRAGRGAEAADAYRRALELVPTAAERRFLERRLREVRQPPDA
jgi:RNA polymerase sigma-70 factor, ECF subfamily